MCITKCFFLARFGKKHTHTHNKITTLSFESPIGPIELPLRPKNIFGKPTEKRCQPKASKMSPLDVHDADVTLFLVTMRGECSPMGVWDGWLTFFLFGERFVRAIFVRCRRHSKSYKRAGVSCTAVMLIRLSFSTYR